MGAVLPGQSQSGIALPEPALLIHDHRCSKDVGPQAKRLVTHASLGVEQKTGRQSPFVIGLTAGFNACAILSLAGFLLDEFVRDEIMDFIMPDRKSQTLAVRKVTQISGGKSSCGTVVGIVCNDGRVQVTIREAGVACQQQLISSLSVSNLHRTGRG